MITATAKRARGDMPVSGTVAGARSGHHHDGNHQHATRPVDGDAMDGTVTHSAREEYPWHARRSKTK